MLKGKEYITLPKKVEAFRTLYLAIQKVKGNDNKTNIYIGISWHVANLLGEGKISRINGRKILDAFNKLTKENTHGL